MVLTPAPVTDPQDLCREMGGRGRAGGDSLGGELFLLPQTVAVSGVTYNLTD